MAIAVASVGSGTVSGATSASLVIGKPTGLAAGDLMVAIANDGGDRGITPPAGWSSIIVNVVSGGSLLTSSFYKVADSSDAAASNFTFTYAVATNGQGVILRLTGAGTGSPINASNSDTDESVTATPTLTMGITQSNADCMLIFGFSHNQSVGVSSYAVTTDNPSWTEDYDGAVTGSGACAMAIAHGSRAQATATGDATATIGAGNANKIGGILIAVNPTISVTSTPSAIVLTSTIPSQGVSASSTITSSAIALNATVNSQTVSATDGRWTNKAKSSAPSITNKPKS